MEPERRGWRVDAVWVLFWVIVSSVWCVTAARHLGATADEAPYVRMGLERWRTGSYQGFMSVGTMPLAADIQTLPLYLAERWRGKPFDVEPELPKVLPWARAATLVFWWALLGHGYLIGRRIAGPWGGRLAVALLACEPNLLAHASLATTDVAVSACALALVYHFHSGRERGWLRRVGVPSACFAALLLAKASAVMFGPVCLVAVGLAWAGGRPNGVPRPLLALARDVPQILTIGFLLGVVYIGSDGRPSEMLQQQAAGKLPPGWKRDVIETYARLPVFCNLTEGILFQALQNTSGTAAYLFGEVHPHGVWYYFPVALSMKLPVALLMMGLVVAATGPRTLANWALLAALALLALSVTYRVQNGVRIVLPLVALGVVGLAAAAVRARETGSARRLVTGAATVAVAWMAVAAAAVWPDGLRYFNEPWRATGRPTYTLVSDSNYDWGQGLKGLNRWHQKHGCPPMLVWTFGNDPAFRTMPVRQYQLDSLQLKTPEEHLPAVRGHYLAASALQVYGYWDTPAVQFLRSRRPVAQASTYLIYDFTESEAGAALK